MLLTANYSFVIIAQRETMRKYELTAVFAGTISDTELEAAGNRVQKLIEDAGAVNLERVALGKHKLSYEVKNNKYGSFAVFTFDAEASSVGAMSNKLKLSKEVVRFVVQLFDAARLKRTPQIADNPLIKASREKEREDRDRERGERYEQRSAGGGDRSERGEREDRNTTAPIFASGHVEKDVIAQAVNDMPVDLEEIDKKLDQLLQGDLTPTV
jgi:ribosomal protein S6